MSWASGGSMLVDGKYREVSFFPYRNPFDSGRCPARFETGSSVRNVARLM
jgi:hypothetical protein